MSDAIRPGHQMVRQRYDHLVETGQLEPVPEQLRIAGLLDDLTDRLAEKRLQRKSSALGWMFARKKPEPVRGLYLHGGVGRGKTMLMDMFFELVPVRRKRRAHFNDFMADIHDRIGRHRAAVKAGTAKGDDPIPPVAAAVADESWLICFDEFTVTDIADAMILSRLFSALFERGVVLVATSNVAPQNLYKDGLNRSLFTPFLATLARYTDMIDVDIDTDFRLRQLDRLPVYVLGTGEKAQARMDAAWAGLCSGKPVEPVKLAVKGRTIEVEQACGASARFSFAEPLDVGACDECPPGPDQHERLHLGVRLALVDRCKYAIANSGPKRVDRRIVDRNHADTIGDVEAHDRLFGFSHRSGPSRSGLAEPEITGERPLCGNHFARRSTYQIADWIGMLARTWRAG